MKPTADDRKILTDRLRRIEGQVRGVTAMMEREESCEAVVQQFAAVRKSMDRAFYDLIACVTRHELAALGVNAPRARARLNEITTLLARYG